MATLRELESLKATIEIQKQEISELKQAVIDIKNEKIVINKSSFSQDNNNDLSIIFTKYKQSLLVKNKYIDKNTTLKCKNELKELGAKWFKNESMQG